ncbi:MAG: hypothetical protein JSW50_06270 [Candidatus Latescibacterota bacterium]|nr:MAG: hypothetical protein JSW50_06270 [Candidatus Latescibacterota bacterium]
METLVWVALIGGVTSVILIQLPRIVVWCLELIEKYHRYKSRRAIIIRREAPADGPDADADDGVTNQ